MHPAGTFKSVVLIKDATVAAVLASCARLKGSPGLRIVTVACETELGGYCFGPYRVYRLLCSASNHTPAVTAEDLDGSSAASRTW